MISSKIKCGTCNRKLKKSFSFCPHCGHPTGSQGNRGDYGMIGRNDAANSFSEELKLPFGMGKIVNSLVKQLERQMTDVNMQNQNGVPRGFRINVTTGNPQHNKAGQILQPSIGPTEKREVVSGKEQLRRSKLQRVDAKSKMKRLADKIIYEIEAPGVKSRKDVSVIELASGIEIKAFSKTQCHVKFIPITAEAIEHYLENEKVFLEMKC
jgi:hypothetical protein